MRVYCSRSWSASNAWCGFPAVCVPERRSRVQSGRPSLQDHGLSAASSFPGTNALRRAVQCSCVLPWAMIDFGGNVLAEPDTCSSSMAGSLRSGPTSSSTTRRDTNQPAILCACWMTSLDLSGGNLLHPPQTLQQTQWLSAALSIHLSVRPGFCIAYRMRTACDCTGHPLGQWPTSDWHVDRGIPVDPPRMAAYLSVVQSPRLKQTLSDWQSRPRLIAVRTILSAVALASFVWHASLEGILCCAIACLRRLWC